MGLQGNSIIERGKKRLSGKVFTIGREMSDASISLNGCGSDGVGLPGARTGLPAVCGERFRAVHRRLIADYLARQGFPVEHLE